MKLTTEKLVSLLNCKDVTLLEEVNLPGHQIQEVGLLSECKKLKNLHLPGNRFQVWRQLDGIFSIPFLESVDLSAAPICLKPKYREYVISHCPPTLRYLDRKAITESDRKRANTEFPDARKDLKYNTSSDSNKSSGGGLEDIFAVKSKPTAQKRIDSDLDIFGELSGSFTGVPTKSKPISNSTNVASSIFATGTGSGASKNSTTKRAPIASSFSDDLFSSFSSSVPTTKGFMPSSVANSKPANTASVPVKDSIYDTPDDQSDSDNSDSEEIPEDIFALDTSTTTKAVVPPSTHSKTSSDEHISSSLIIPEVTPDSLFTNAPHRDAPSDALFSTESIVFSEPPSNSTTNTNTTAPHVSKLSAFNDTLFDTDVVPSKKPARNLFSDSGSPEADDLFTANTQKNAAAALFAPTSNSNSSGVENSSTLFDEPVLSTSSIASNTSDKPKFNLFDSSDDLFPSSSTTKPSSAASTITDAPEPTITATTTASNDPQSLSSQHADDHASFDLHEEERDSSPSNNVDNTLNDSFFQLVSSFLSTCFVGNGLQTSLNVRFTDDDAHVKFIRILVDKFGAKYETEPEIIHTEHQSTLQITRTLFIEILQGQKAFAAGLRASTFTVDNLTEVFVFYSAFHFPKLETAFEEISSTRETPIIPVIPFELDEESDAERNDSDEDSEDFKVISEVHHDVDSIALIGDLPLPDQGVLQQILEDNTRNEEAAANALSLALGELQFGSNWDNVDSAVDEVVSEHNQVEEEREPVQAHDNLLEEFTTALEPAVTVAPVEQSLLPEATQEVETTIIETNSNDNDTPHHVDAAWGVWQSIYETDAELLKLLLNRFPLCYKPHSPFWMANAKETIHFRIEVQSTSANEFFSISLLLDADRARVLPYSDTLPPSHCVLQCTGDTLRSILLGTTSLSMALMLGQVRIEAGAERIALFTASFDFSTPLGELSNIAPSTTETQSSNDPDPLSSHSDDIEHVDKPEESFSDPLSDTHKEDHAEVTPEVISLSSLPAATTTTTTPDFVDHSQLTKSINEPITNDDRSTPSSTANSNNSETNDRLTAAFHFLMSAFRGGQNISEGQMQVLLQPVGDDSTPNIVVTITADDIELQPESENDHYSCQLQASKSAMFDFLTGKQTVEALSLAQKSHTDAERPYFKITEQEKGAFAHFCSAFDFSASNFRLWKVEQGFHPDNDSLLKFLPESEKLKEILAYIPTCFIGNEYRDGVQIKLVETDDEIPIFLDVHSERMEGTTNKFTVFASRVNQPIANANNVTTIEMSFSRFFTIIVGTVDASTAIMENEVRFSSRVGCLAFFQAMQLDPTRYYTFVRVLRETGNVDAATKAITGNNNSGKGQSVTKGFFSSFKK